MALKDYQALDGEDYYISHERSGVVSVWVLGSLPPDLPEGLEPMQDWCAVGAYDLDFHEQNHFDFRPVPPRELFDTLSYASSWAEAAVASCEAHGLDRIVWVMAQFRFAYDRSRVVRPVSDIPTFLGVFPYDKD